LAIKHHDFDTARTLLDGKLEQFLVGGEGLEDRATALSYALKIILNSVYGYTSAKFSNPFRDIRNKDNIVAKRGALFMIDLKHAVQERGFSVVHIKTDSIKIPNATAEIIKFIIDYGNQYGYEFECEDTYDKFCLVNDAVYVAKTNGEWVTVGAQFAHPYVYKTLFSHEAVALEDLYETRSVTQGAMYLDFESDRAMALHPGMVFIGRTGRFVPVSEDVGGVLWRIKDGKQYAVTRTKGYFWVEAEKIQEFGLEEKIDMSYYHKLVDDAFEVIQSFGSYADFIDERS
jgi:hypothetical protein